MYVDIELMMLWMTILRYMLTPVLNEELYVYFVWTTVEYQMTLHECISGYIWTWRPLDDGLVEDCSNSIDNALELLQSSTKPSILQLAEIHWPACDHHGTFYRSQLQLLFFDTVFLWNNKL